MHRIPPLFQRRADLILQGLVDQAVLDYQTPLWLKLRGRYYEVESRDSMWQVLSRQHLSQKARGVDVVQGRVEAITPLTHGGWRVTTHWQESTDPRLADAARWYRTVHVCRPAEEDFRITGLAVWETRPVPEDARPKGFPPPCQDW